MRVFDRIRKKVFILTAFAMCLPLAGNIPAGNERTNTVSAQEPVVKNGVSVDGIDLSGLTRSEAKEKIEQKVEELSSVTVVLTNDTYGNVETTLGDIGLSADYDEAVEKAVTVGNSGDVLKRYKENKNIESGKGVDYRSKKTVNQGMLSSVVNAEIGSRINAGADTTLIKRDDGTVKVTASNLKMSVDYNKVVDAINAKLEEDSSASEIKTDLIVTENDDNSAAALEEITSLLGTYTTDYERQRYLMVR